ncbi:MAG: hypothetical protein ACJ748_04230 [Flavisolibacter sp.]
MKQIGYIVLILLFVPCFIHGQVLFSLTSDASLLRNLSPQQKFWSFGQTIQGQFHFSKKESAYIWVCYYTPGIYKNSYTAVEKNPGTIPSQINYTVRGRWLPRQMSIGWRHYLKGSFDNNDTWNLYTIVGFGIMISTLQNTFNLPIDTSKYTIPSNPIEGNSSFRRLTFDLGLGGEFAIGSDIFLYGEGRILTPASDKNPSSYFHNYSHVPLSLTMNAGIRVLFNFDYGEGSEK